MPSFDDEPDPSTAPQARPIWRSIKRGFRGRCPACEEGRLLRGYLVGNDCCPRCGEELHHHRADDFPKYITIFVVGHILIAALLAVDDIWPNLPLLAHVLIWPSLVIVLSLWLLPRVKGALIAYQWALRMHGFETAHAVRTEPKNEPAKSLQRSAA